MENLINKFRYPVIITSVLSTIFLILRNLDIISITDDSVNLIVNSIVSLLVMLGFAVAPDDKLNENLENVNNMITVVSKDDLQNIISGQEEIEDKQEK